MIKIPAYFTRYGSRTDGSFGLSFATQEVPPDTVMEFQRNLNSFGWLLFGANPDQLEVPKEMIEDDRKSPSERLYAVLYLYWKQKNEDIPFDVWRLRYMEKLIESIKGKLNN